MFQAYVYKIMIGAPSDVKEEVEMVFKAIHQWNSLNSEIRKIILLPIFWDMDSYPTLHYKPQKAINKQLVDKSDMLICIFGSKIGSPTDDNISGTVEEIEEHRKANKPVMAFFKKELDSSIGVDQISKVLEFKKNFDGLFSEFSHSDDFISLVLNKLSLSINDNFISPNIIQDSKPETNISISDSDIEALKEWVTSGSEDAHSIDLIGGRTTIILGYKQFDISSPRERVKWNGFFERMEELGFIEICGYTGKQNKPRYRLKEAAYDFIDNLS